LIDAGGEATGDDRYKQHLLSDLDSFFANRRDLNRTLQAIIISHPHIDHTRLLMDVFQNFTVKYFYDGGDEIGKGVKELKQARSYVTTHAIHYEAIRDKNIGEKGFTPAGLSTQSVGADVRFLAGARDCGNANNNSLVVRVQDMGRTALFTGDSEIDDDENCEEGQVEHLLERYDGTDMLRADVYKVGHHGSHNGTDEAFVSAVSPELAILTAGHKETKGPGPFHGFYFGHPREGVVELLEATAGNRTPPIGGYTYLKGTRNSKATDTIIEGRLISKAIYCTCWDGDVTVAMNKGADKIAVSVGEHGLAEENRPVRAATLVDLTSELSTSALEFANEPDRSHASGSPPDSHPSDRPRWRFVVVVFLIVLVIYAVVRMHELRSEDLRKKIAGELIEKARGGEGWEFTRFEVGALVREIRRDQPLLWRLWPQPRTSVDEVVEQAVAVLIPESYRSSDERGERKSLIERLERLHSDPGNSANMPSRLPSTAFLIAATSASVLLLAIQAVPSVGSHMADFFGHSSFLEELWTGLLAAIVGTGATALGRRSVQHRQTKKSARRRQRGKNERKPKPETNI